MPDEKRETTGNLRYNTKRLLFRNASLRSFFTSVQRREQIMHNKTKSLTADEIIELLPKEQIRHSRNVRKLMKKFSAWLTVSGNYPFNMLYDQYGPAAYYHDIGKICVPPELLTKTGPLTREEYHMIQNHTVFAGQVFGWKGIGILEPLLSLASDAAVYHHEWWDGTGYPYRLAENSIPFIARVTAICDCYDAMVSTRSYRKAHSHDYACTELIKGSGTQFEPGLILLFIAHEEEIRQLLYRLRASNGNP